jgi:hypothetical protein
MELSTHCYKVSVADIEVVDIVQGFRGEANLGTQHLGCFVGDSEALT